MGDSVPVFSNPSDHRLWKNLDEIEKGMSSGKAKKYGSSFKNLIEELCNSNENIHTAILSRLLKMILVNKTDDLVSIVIRLMERCKLSDSFPQLIAVDILLNNGNIESAKSILERMTELSDRAYWEYECGKVDVAEGNSIAANVHFLKARSINDSFIPVYDALNDADPKRGWSYIKNIAVLRKGKMNIPFEVGIASNSAQELFGIYWEWENGNKSSAWAMLSTTTEFTSRDKEYILAAARICRDQGKYGEAIEYYKSIIVDPETTESVLLELADTYLVAGMPERALDICKEIAKIDPFDRRYLEHTMRAYAQLSMKSELNNFSKILLHSEHCDLDAYTFTIGLMTSLSMHSDVNGLINKLTTRCPGEDVIYLLSSKNDYESQRYIAALLSANKAVRKMPNDPESKCQRARVYLKMGKTKKALRDVNDSLSKNKDHVPSLMLKKDILTASDDYNGAYEICRDVLSNDPRNADAIKDSAHLLGLMDRGDESLAAYREALGIREDITLFTNVIVTLIENEKYHKVIDLVKDYDDIYGKYDRVWILKGNTEYKIGRFLDASDSYSKAIEISPYDPLIWHCKGMADEAAGNLEDAEVAYDKAVLMDLDNSDYWISKSSIQEKKDNYAGAIDSLNRVITEHPGNVYALVKKAIILVKLNKDTDALFFIDLALKINPSNLNIIKIKKDIYKHLKDYSKVVSMCEAIKFIGPVDESIFIDMSDALVSMGRYGESILALGEASKLYPESVTILAKKMESHRLQGDIEEEISIARVILSKDQHNLVVKTELADAYARKGEKDTAKKIYDELHAENPQDASITVKKAKMSSDSGNDNDAILMLKGVLKNDPDNFDTLIELAGIMSNSGNEKEAMTYLDRAIGIKPMESKGYLMKARVLVGSGHYVEAQSVLNEALHSTPEDDPEIWECMGEIQEKRGDFNHALISYDAATKKGIVSADIYRSRGRVQEALGMKDAALNSYAFAIVNNPRDVIAIERTGTIQAAMGRESIAIRNLEDAISLDPTYAPAFISRASIYKSHNDIDSIKKLLDIYEKNDNVDQKVISELKMFFYDSDVKPEENQIESLLDVRSESNTKVIEDSLHWYARELLNNAYETGFALDDEMLIKKTGIPSGMSSEVLSYIADIREYGDIVTGSREFNRLEVLSNNVVIKENLEDIESEPLISIPFAYISSGARDIDEAKVLIAYIYKVMMENTEPKVFRDEIGKAVEEMREGSGDISVFALMKRYGFGVYSAKTVKLLVTKESGSVSVHI